MSRPHWYSALSFGCYAGPSQCGFKVKVSRSIRERVAVSFHRRGTMNRILEVKDDDGIAEQRRLA